LIDCDAKRPAGISASDEEHDRAHAKAVEIDAWLADQGWPPGFMADSGNGAHLLFRIDEPRDDDGLIKSCLEALADKFNDDRVQIDLSVFNPARIWKLYGTKAGKGDPEAAANGRPHRTAKLTSAPDQLDIVPTAKLRALAAEAPIPKPPSNRHASNGNGNGKPWDMEEFISRFGLRTQPAANHKNGTKWVFEECPFNAEHTAPDAALFLGADGKPGFKCFHNSCSSNHWEQLREKIDPGCYDRRNEYQSQQPRSNGQTKGPDEKPVPTKGVRIWEPKLLTTAEFEAGDFRQEYVVSKVLVKGQPFIVGGQSKTLKTSLLTDLVVSIGVFGQSFLGQFPVTRPGRTLFLSGESGEYTLQETMRRIAKAKGVDPNSVNALWGFSLPSISSGMDLDTLAKIIAKEEVDVVIIDPAYLCLLAGAASNVSSSNVFQMGSLLRELSAVGVETGCTMGLIHHTTKRIERPGEAPALEDLSMSGFAEWARQWLRERYEEGTGVHKLWLRVGGSAGHSGLYAVDVDEGVPDEHFKGRKWEVTVNTAGEARSKQADQKKADADQKERDRLTTNMDRVAKFLDANPEGETAKAIKDEIGLKTPEATAAINQLLFQGAIERCDVFRGNRRAPYPGFRRPGKKDEKSLLQPPG
jgi:hypothetical protein